MENHQHLHQYNPPHHVVVDRASKEKETVFEDENFRVDALNKRQLKGIQSNSTFNEQEFSADTLNNAVIDDAAFAAAADGFLHNLAGAIVMEVDGFQLCVKAEDDELFSVLVKFVVDCHIKPYLKRFDDPVYDPHSKVLAAVCPDQRKHLKKKRNINVAKFAVDEYNKFNKEEKWELLNLLKVNILLDFDATYYLTIRARNMKTMQIKTFQAAVLEYSDVYALGLFRSVENAKILAILSVKGTEEEVKAKLKARTDIRAEAIRQCQKTKVEAPETVVEMPKMEQLPTTKSAKSKHSGTEEEVKAKLKVCTDARAEVIRQCQKNEVEAPEAVMEMPKMERLPTTKSTKSKLE